MSSYRIGRRPDVRGNTHHVGQCTPAYARVEDERFLNHLSELRQQADYGYEAITDDVAELVTRTEQFVTEMESLCQNGE